MSHINASIEKQTLSQAFRSGARILENKGALVFGAGGSIGAAFAKDLRPKVRESFWPAEPVATQITAAGGEAQTAVVDALDNAAGNRHLDDVAKQAGKIDILVDLTGPLASEYGKVVLELPVDKFMASLTTIVKSHFITARVEGGNPPM